MNPNLIVVIIIISIWVVMSLTDNNPFNSVYSPPGDIYAKEDAEKYKKHQRLIKCREEGLAALSVLESRYEMYDNENLESTAKIIRIERRMATEQNRILIKHALKKIKEDIDTYTSSIELETRNSVHVRLLKEKANNPLLITERELNYAKGAEYYDLTDKYQKDIDIVKDEVLVFRRNFKVELSDKFKIKGMHDKVNENALSTINDLGLCLLYDNCQHSGSMCSNTTYYVTLDTWVEDYRCNEHLSNSQTSIIRGIRKII